jgi:hypothetical protein
LRTPFGEAHLPRPELPKPPQLPHLHFEDLQSSFAELQSNMQKLSEASRSSQKGMRRMFESVAHFQEELGRSAKLMFDEEVELWDECLRAPGHARDTSSASEKDASTRSAAPEKQPEA